MKMLKFQTCTPSTDQREVRVAVVAQNRLAKIIILRKHSYKNPMLGCAGWLPGCSGLSHLQCKLIGFLFSPVLL